MEAIRGIVLEGSISDRLIVEATPADVRRIAAGTAVQVSGSHGLDGFDDRVQRLFAVLMGDGLLYDGNGNAVAALVGVTPQSNAFDVSGFSDSDDGRTFVTGLRSIRIEARAL